MLLNKETISTEEFIAEFNKRFTSFAGKAPMLISFFVTPDGVRIYEGDSGSPDCKVALYKLFDYSKSVKENIKDIKDYLLEHHYPKFSTIVTEKRELTQDDVRELMDKGLSASEILEVNVKEVSRKVTYRVEKVIIMRDELFLRNLETGRCYRYKMKTPVSIFLRTYREAKDKDTVFPLFAAKSIFLNEIYDNYEEGK